THTIALWETYVSVTEPTIFALFTVEYLSEMDEIARTTRRQDFVKAVKVMVASHHNYFSGLRHGMLRSMISEAGFEIS
ncbi:MAG: hypothetical protein ACFE7R_10925, partial [Candidatus Hodarchaeota archaeon]